MAGFFISAFNWAAFMAAITPPAREISESSAKFASKNPEYCCPSTVLSAKNGLAKAFAKLFASNAWYANLSVEDSRRLDGLVHAIFSGDIKVKNLKPAAISNGVSLDVVDVIRGRVVIDTKRSKPKPGGTLFTPTKKENKATPEMQYFGMRPFRHPEWDRRVAQDANTLMALQSLHLPPYSIHSDEETTQLLQEVTTSVSLFEKLKDSELKTNFEEDLLQPLAQAAKSKQGIYVAADY
jgi:hypothetical protein